jgi:hypothetical protein
MASATATLRLATLTSTDVSCTPDQITHMKKFVKQSVVACCEISITELTIYVIRRQYLK